VPELQLQVDESVAAYPTPASSDAFSFAGFEPAPEVEPPHAADGELDMSRLRQAINILDRAFRRPQAPTEIVSAEPMYADLVVATAGRPGL
jgi:hypothetical protein